MGLDSPIFGYRVGPTEDLRIPRAARPAPFSGALAVSRILDPTTSRLTDLLGSGSARNLAEAFQQLNPSEQNNLRERWGRSLDELISLSSERDATIFHHGLLEVGHRLEDADQVELAGAVYSALVGNSPRPPLNLRGGEGSVRASSESSPPLNLRGGQEGLLPVLTRAQSRLNAINGVGDWRSRLAFNLERLPSNATRWDMLCAMGGAGLVFRSVRLAATARWAANFESAFALNAAVTSTAFLSETAAFTSLGRLFGTMAGNHYDWSAEGTFNEWAGGAAMLLGLKAMGGVFGNLSERWAAGETAFVRVTRAVAPQAGMFSGIVLGNRLAELGGFHPERHGDTWLVDGLTTLLEFNVAGRLQRAAGGPGLANLEGRMEAYARALGRGAPSSTGKWGEGLREFFSTLGPRPELVTPEGVRIESAEDPRRAHLVFSMGNQDGDGSGGDAAPSAGKTLPYGTPREMNGAEPPTGAAEIDSRLRETRPEAPSDSAPDSTIKVSSALPIEIPLFVEGIRLGPKGRFVVQRHLGRGGTANAYLAVDTSNGRSVVLKVPHGSTDLSPEEITEHTERIRREIWIGTNLGSNYAATVYDHFELFPGSNVMVQVMEYVEGENLAMLLYRHRTGDKITRQRFTLPFRIHLLENLLAGFSDAHGKRLSHGDPKPENVIVDRRGIPRILDWGQAKYHPESASPEHPLQQDSLSLEALKRRPTHETTPGRKGGTLGYMAPEHQSSLPPPFPYASDIYALGIIAYEVLTGGLHPFAYYQENPAIAGAKGASGSASPRTPRLIPRMQENGVLELNELGSIFYGSMPKIRPPRFADILAEPVSPHLRELEQVVFRAFSPRAEDRFQSVREFREALLMAGPRAEYKHLGEQRSIIAREYQQMLGEWSRLGDPEAGEENVAPSEADIDATWNRKADGRVIPAGRWRALHQPIEELRQKHQRWERGVDRLLNELAGLAGRSGIDSHAGELAESAGGEAPGYVIEQDWREAHRMIAELNFQLLNDQIDLHPRDVRADYMEQIRLNDTGTASDPRPTLRLAMEAAVPVPFSFREINGGEVVTDHLHFELYPFLREVSLAGRESGFMRKGVKRWEGDAAGLRDLRLPAGYHVIRVLHPEFREFNIPLRIDFEQVRGVVEGGTSPLLREFDLIPNGSIDDGMVLVPGGDAYIGLNIFGGENVITTYGFPERRVRIPTVALSRDPVTMGEYWDFVHRVLTLQGVDEATRLIPRTLRSNPARTFKERVKASYLAARNEDRGYQLFWNIEDRGRKAHGLRYEMQPLTSIHDTSREPLRDPNGDPIYREQPTNSITYPMAQAYVEDRSTRHGRRYSIPPAYILEAVTKSFFPMNFTSGNVFDPESYVSRQIFADKRMAFPQAVGTHPLGRGYDRDHSLFGTQGHLGNVREFTSTPGEKNTIAVFGGSIGVIPGPLYYPASRNWLVVDRPVPAAGSFRLMEVFQRKK